MDQKYLKILVLVVVSLAVVLVAFWCIRLNKVAEVSQPTSPTIERKAVIDESKYPQHITDIPGTDHAWYSIPELGIRFTIQKDMAKDLIYFYDGEKSIGTISNPSEKSVTYRTVFFSSKTLLIGIGKSCSPERKAIGSLKIVFEDPKYSYGFKVYPDPKKGLENSYVGYQSSPFFCPEGNRLDVFAQFEEKGFLRFSKFFQSQDFINSLELTK